MRSAAPSALPAAALLAAALLAATAAASFDGQVRVRFPRAPLAQLAADPAQMFATEQVERGFELWADMVNEAGGLHVGAARLRVNYTALEVPLDTAAAYYNATRDAAAAGHADFFFGPLGSSYTVEVARAAEEAGLITISGHAASDSIDRCSNEYPDCAARAALPGSLRFSNLFKLQQGAGNIWDPALGIFALHGLRRVAVFGDSTDLGFITRIVEMRSAANFNMQVLVSRYVPYVLTPEDAASLVAECQDAGVEVLVGGFWLGDSCSNLLRAMREADYSPAGTVLLQCMSTAEFGRDVDAGLVDPRYVMHLSGWDARMRGTDYAEQAEVLGPAALFPATAEKFSPLLYYEALSARYGAEAASAGLWTPTATLVGVALTNALQRAGSTNASLVATALNSMSMRTFYGPVSMDAFQRRTESHWTVYQQLEGGSSAALFGADVVSPANWATRPQAVVPAPTWAERQQSLPRYETASERAVLGLGGATAALFAALLVAVWRFRTHPAILAGSPSLCAALLFGGLVLVASTLAMSVNPTAAQCNARAVLMAPGAWLMLGALLAKNTRLWVLFTSADRKGLSRVSAVSNRALLVGLGAGAAALLAAGGALVAVAPFESVLVEPHPFRPSYNYVECRRADSGLADALVFGAVALFVLAVVAAGALSFLLRDTPSAFNESRHVAMSVFSVVLACACGVPVLQSSQGIGPEQFYLVSSLLVLIVVAGIASILMLPKFAVVFNASEREVRRNYKVHRDAERGRLWRHQAVPNTRATTAGGGGNTTAGSGRFAPTVSVTSPVLPADYRGSSPYAGTASGGGGGYGSPHGGAPHVHGTASPGESTSGFTTCGRAVLRLPTMPPLPPLASESGMSKTDGTTGSSVNAATGNGGGDDDDDKSPSLGGARFASREASSTPAFSRRSSAPLVGSRSATGVRAGVFCTPLVVEPVLSPLASPAMSPAASPRSDERHPLGAAALATGRAGHGHRQGSPSLGSVSAMVASRSPGHGPVEMELGPFGIPRPVQHASRSHQNSPSVSHCAAPSTSAAQPHTPPLPPQPGSFRRKNSAGSVSRVHVVSACGAEPSASAVLPATDDLSDSSDPGDTPGGSEDEYGF